MSYRKHVLLIAPLLLSGLVHLSNLAGFPIPTTDEGTYLGRSINVLEGFGPHDPYYGYDHPFFGQLFTATVFGIIAYPDSLNISDYANAQTLEALFLVPRALMGLLAVFDTFLIFKISERRYNTTAGFIAAMLFAIMPITWVTRWIHLDSIQMPFILLSIYFALKGKVTISRNNGIPGSKNNYDILTVLISGIFLGLAIFTKIPAFTLVLPVGYLIIANNKSEGNILKMFSLWIIPVILIPLIWPMYAISVGQFDNWLFGIYDQATREKLPLSLSIMEFFRTDPVLLSLGVISVIFSAIRKDFFITFFIVPYLVFLYFVGFVTIFHLLPLIVGLSIASGIFLSEISKKASPNIKVNKALPYVIIAALGVIGIISTSDFILKNSASHYFEAAAFVNGYMQGKSRNYENDDINPTVISSPFYLWIPKYKFHMDNYSEWGVKRIEAQSAISIIDDAFKKALSDNKVTGGLYKKIFDTYETYEMQRFEGNNGSDSITVLLTDFTAQNMSKLNAKNLIDNDYTWEPSNSLKLVQNNSNLKALINTSNTGKEFNRAALNTNLVSSEGPLLFSLSYASNSSFGNATFLLQIVDKADNKYWTQLLHHTFARFEKDLFVLPDFLLGKQVEIRLTAVTEGPGQHTLIVKEAVLI
jgi:hypothetical protein